MGNLDKCLFVVTEAGKAFTSVLKKPCVSRSQGIAPILRQNSQGRHTVDKITRDTNP